MKRGDLGHVSPFPDFALTRLNRRRPGKAGPSEHYEPNRSLFLPVGLVTSMTPRAMGPRHPIHPGREVYKDHELAVMSNMDDFGHFGAKGHSFSAPFSS